MVPPSRASHFGVTLFLTHGHMKINGFEYHKEHGTFSARLLDVEVEV